MSTVVSGTNRTTPRAGSPAAQKSNQYNWLPKLDRNVIRDAEHHLAELGQLGWDVLVIWERDVVHDAGIAERIRGFLERGDG